jgi:hypothetical protein
MIYRELICDGSGYRLGGLVEVEPVNRSGCPGVFTRVKDRLCLDPPEFHSRHGDGLLADCFGNILLVPTTMNEGDLF